tara:strand:+ start:346 stop:531 length:186 start_codon:yes stop_codon:yes gene_type:complete
LSGINIAAVVLLVLVFQRALRAVGDQRCWERAAEHKGLKVIYLVTDQDLSASDSRWLIICK